MSTTVSCVRCGTTVPRPKDKRSRCAACGTALPLFEDDPSLPVPVLPVPDRTVQVRPPMPPQVSATLGQAGALADQLPASEGWEDFTLEPSGEHQLPPPAPGPAAAPAARRSITPVTSPAAQAPAQPGQRAAAPPAIAPTPAPIPRQAARPPTFAPASDGGGRSKSPLVLAGLVVILVGGGLALFLRGDAPPEAPATAMPQQAPVATTPAALPAPVEIAAPAPAQVATSPAPPAPTRPAAPRPALRGAAAEPPPAGRPARPPEPRVAFAAGAAPARSAPVGDLPPPPPPPPPVSPAPTATPAVTATALSAASSTAPAPVAAPQPAPEPAPQPAPAIAVNPADLNRKARLVVPTCLQDNLKLPRDVSTDGETIRVRFSVGLDGLATDLAFLTTPSDPRVARAIRAAIERCRFTPGTDGKGALSTQPVLMPLRFDGR